MPRGRQPICFSYEELFEIEARYVAGASLEELARDFGVTGPTIRARLTTMGVPIRPRFTTGQRHGAWRGGRTVDSSGYVRAWVARDDPMHVMANCAGQVPEHRLVLARALGRPLTRQETVHHIDGDRENNDLTNLQLRQGRHGAGVALRCRDCGSPNIMPATI